VLFSVPKGVTQPGAETTQDTIHTFLSPYFKSATKLIWQNCNLHLADKQGAKEAVLNVFVLPITALMHNLIKRYGESREDFY